ncbi:putative metallopeptidase [Tissierella sp.]|uniref:putative metallopeptidase n=1 Tax=Tissierella sp. TaxID=41274 RepID=UPI0030D9EFD5
MERMQREQIIALIYHELIHIREDGDMIKHDIEDSNSIKATFGTDWPAIQARIKNLLEEEILWRELEPLAKQNDMFSLEEFNNS